MPRSLHSDQGREFESGLTAELCKLLHIEKTRTNPYRPQSDGLAERFNRTLQQMLSAFVTSVRDDWDDHIPYVMMAYRASQQASTGCTPNLLFLSREIALPVDLMFPTPGDSEILPECPQAYVEWVRLTLRNAHTFARQKLRSSATRQKRLYDRGSKDCYYPVGFWVWQFYPPSGKQKFGQKWVGPYLVLGRLGQTVYEVRKEQMAYPVRVHVDHLKPCLSFPEGLEPWVLADRAQEEDAISDDDDEHAPEGERRLVENLLINPPPYELRERSQPPDRYGQSS